MSYTDAVRRDALRVMLAQALLTIVMAAGFWSFGEGRQALAALYGGGITMLLTGWLAWRVRRAGVGIGGLGSIYSGAIARYALAALGVGVGIGLFKLAPLPLLCTFAVTQFGFVALWNRR